MGSSWGKSWASAFGNSWGVVQEADSAAAQPTGGWYLGEQQDFSHLPKPRTAEQLKAERIRLGILEQEKAQIEQEAAAVRQEVPKNGTEQEIQQRIYLALLNEQLAMQEAQEALLMAKLRALEYELEQQALSVEAAMIMEQDVAFCMAMLAVA